MVHFIYETFSFFLIHFIVIKICFYLFMHTGVLRRWHIKRCSCRCSTTRPVSLMEQELPTIPEYRSSLFHWCSCCCILSFLCIALDHCMSFGYCIYVLWCTASNYLFDILNRSFSGTCFAHIMF